MDATRDDEAHSNSSSTRAGSSHGEGGKPCGPPFCLPKNLSWSSSTRRCQQLRWKDAPWGTSGYGALQIGHYRTDSTSNSLHFWNENVATAALPLHLYVRYGGTSRHDEAPWLPRRRLPTPVLSLMSLLVSLVQLPHTQLRKTSITIMLNGAANTTGHVQWLREHLNNLTAIPFAETATHGGGPGRLASVDVRVWPSGNEATFNSMKELILKVKDPTAIIFSLEDDYLHAREMLPTIIEFFKAYNPCMVSPSEGVVLPDMNKAVREHIKHFYARNVVLKGVRGHWRSITSTGVTWAARLHVVRDLVRIRGLEFSVPGVGSAQLAYDYEVSLFIASTLGIFAPLPALSSQMHRDFPRLQSLDFEHPAREAEMERLAVQLRFPVCRGSRGRG